MPNAEPDDVLDEGGLSDQNDQNRQAPADDWKAPASQDELDRIIEKRLRSERNKFKDYDTVKERAALYDQLLATTQTDAERAVAEAEERAYNAAMGSTVPRLVRAEFRAAAKGVLDKAQLDALLEDVDLTKYVDDNGEPDTDRIESKIALLTPKTPPPSFGQGNRGSASKNTNMNDFIRAQAGLLPG